MFGFDVLMRFVYLMGWMVYFVINSRSLPSYYCLIVITLLLSVWWVVYWLVYLLAGFKFVFWLFYAFLLFAFWEIRGCGFYLVLFVWVDLMLFLIVCLKLTCFIALFWLFSLLFHVSCFDCWVLLLLVCFTVDILR